MNSSVTRDFKQELTQSQRHYCPDLGPRYRIEGDSRGVSGVKLVG
ncbi:MAG TPA: hypothetical protein VF886_07255 [Roseiarcus sp.]